MYSKHGTTLACQPIDYGNVLQTLRLLRLNKSFVAPTYNVQTDPVNVIIKSWFLKRCWKCLNCTGRSTYLPVTQVF